MPLTKDPVIAIQIGAVSFVDEDVDPLLGTLQERAGVNALFLATPTWTRGTGGRQVPGHPLPDHGEQEYDWDWVGGNYATIHPQHYGGTMLGAAGAAPEHPGWDLFEAVVPEAKRRGIACYAWMEESSYAQLYRDIYGVAKACNPAIQVGWHIYHNLSFNPFYRADQDYGELSHLSDFIKVVAYNNCAGPRFHAWVENACRSLFADTTPQEIYPVLLKLLGVSEAPYAELPAKGFSAEYVRRETARAVAGVEGRSAIYPGIDIDIPVGPAAENKNPTASATTGIGAATSGEGITRCSRQQVRDAVLAAFEGGAQGVVLSRKYSEMRLDNLSGAGDALRELGR